MQKPPPPPINTVDILARTLWGEARSESTAGIAAIAAVILNRVHIAKNNGRAYWWGTDIAGVCLKPWQFSCWNANDPNRPALRAVTTQDAAFRQCLQIAKQAVCGQLTDPTGGATHYHTTNTLPHWAEDQVPVCLIGNHVFYCLH